MRMFTIQLKVPLKGPPAAMTDMAELTTNPRHWWRGESESAKNYIASLDDYDHKGRPSYIAVEDIT